MLVNIWGAGFLDDFSLRFFILAGFISKRSCVDPLLRSNTLDFVINRLQLMYVCYIFRIYMAKPI